MKLSIILPVYNLPDLTKRAFESIPYDEDLEVIAVDDHSDKDTIDVLKQFEDRARIVYLKENHRPNYCRNLAMDMCQGEYMIGLDNDDYFFTDEFRKAIRKLDGTDIVFIDQRINDGTVWHLCEENKHIFCAFWTRFLRMEFVGDTRSPLTARYNGDWFFNEELMKKPHTEKYTGIVAYHYNYPREGSMIWQKDHEND